MRTIRVTGRAVLRLRPDVTRITVNLRGCRMEYAETMEMCENDTRTIKAALSDRGFSAEDVKTVLFSVDVRNESYQDENNNWKQRFAGYEYTHTLKVEFGSDSRRLGEILHELSLLPVHPELSVAYTVKDREIAVNRLIGAAVADAKEKAGVLSEAAGVKLGDIQNIEYSRGMPDFEISPIRNDMMISKRAALSDAPYAVDITPDDIEVSDTVTVIWEISQI